MHHKIDIPVNRKDNPRRRGTNLKADSRNANLRAKNKSERPKWEKGFRV